MKLVDCVIMGRFLGLRTVEECYHNAFLHYFPILPYDEAKKAAAQLEIEMDNYMAGILTLDWSYIDEQVEKQDKELDEYMEKNPLGNVDFNNL